MQKSKSTRRNFLQQSGSVLAGATLAGTLSTRAYAGENTTIKIALVGCGGRGTGAALNALSTQGPTKLWAMADVFPDRIEGSLNYLSKFLSDPLREKRYDQVDAAGAKSSDPARRQSKQIDVPPERQFIGMDAYKKAIDALDPGDVVLLATPPAFRPIHLEYAVEKGRNVFMEKSFAVDAPGIHRVLRAGELAATKNLKIAGGLMTRHSKATEEAVQQIHDGAIGEVITVWAYRVHGPAGMGGAKGPQESELAHQIRNYSNFTWLNGTFVLDWLIHNIDVACWVKGAWPVSAQGQGGRQVRTAADQMFDHFAVEYSFADGTRLFAQGRHMANTWDFYADVVHGAKGSAFLGEFISRPLIYKGHTRASEDVIWRHKGSESRNPYQVEHDLLFDAIRQNKPYNETQRCAKSAMTGILGRMAAESGREITWDQAMASQIELAPGLDKYTMDSPAPVMPDAQGHYPIAMPGITKVL
jgi:predicted dehydrogenase